MNRVPDGFITLKEAFSLLVERLPFGQFPAPRQFDDSNFNCPNRKFNEELYQSLSSLLSQRIGAESGGLDVFYWLDDWNQPDRVLPEHWRDSHWPERTFSGDNCQSFLDDSMAKYNGQVLITRKGPFIAWLDAISSNPEPRLPPDEDWITLTEAVTWIGFKHSISANQYGQVPGPGYFGLSCSESEARLKEACVLLTKKAAGGHIRISGRYVADMDSQPKTIPHILSDMECMAFCRFSHIDRMYPTDKVFPHFIDVRVNCAELLKAFPPLNMRFPHGYSYKAGLPGRPSIMDLVLQEFERRWMANEYAGSQQAEANALEEWVRLNHVNAPQKPKAKTIRNKIGPLVRAKTCPKL
ncbi:MAG: hypothetical protein H3C28_03955 [Sphingomonadales bacterium]|nr:hypothetical protein [Sphingomonadales bacterium]